MTANQPQTIAPGTEEAFVELPPGRLIERDDFREKVEILFNECLEEVESRKTESGDSSEKSRREVAELFLSVLADDDCVSRGDLVSEIIDMELNAHAVD